jgi:CubicO group peptidase (beta-lactamase class C family)
MARFLWVKVATFCLYALSFGLASPVVAQDCPQASACLDADLAASVDAHVLDVMETLNIPGAAVAIVRDGDVVYLKGYGRADDQGRLVTPQTPFVLASVSKSFTALAVMQLVEAGQIDLDAPLTTYLPWFRTADADASARIRVRDLLYQTSGFSTRTGREFSQDTTPEGLENLIRSLSGAALVAEPGSDSFNYSNTNYDIMGLIVQTITGMPFHDYVRTAIYQPLGMTHSFSVPELAAAREAGLSTGYTSWFGGVTASEYYFPAAHVPSGGLISSAEDLARYVQMHLNGGEYAGQRLLSAEGIERLHRADGSTFREPFGYAMGWFSGLLPDAPLVREEEVVYRSMISHDGWSTGWRTQIVLLPGENLGIVTLMNSDDYSRVSGSDHMAQGAARLVLGYPAGQMYLYEAPLVQNIRIILLGVIGFLLFGAIWSIFNLWRWRRQPQAHPRGFWWVARAVIVPLLIDLALLYAFVVVLPDMNQVSLPTVLRSTPELAALFIPLLVLVAGWGIVRTVLYAAALRRRV